MFKSKYKVSAINEKWEMIQDNLKLNTIPAQDELIYFETLGKYYQILKVIHNITKNHDIVLVIRELSQDLKLF